MTEVRWTDEAATDLQAIHDYIARDFVIYANSEVQKILQAVDTLETFPETGRIVPEHDREDLREIVLPPYRIVYRSHRDVVHILTVFRAERRLPDLPDT